MTLSVIDAVNLSLLSLTLVLSYLSYASQSRDTVNKTLEQLADIEYSSDRKLRVSLYDYRFRIFDSLSRTTLIFREYEWGSETPWAGRPAEFLSGTGRFETGEDGEREQTVERRRRAAERIIQYAIEEFEDGIHDERDPEYWRDLVLEVEMTAEGLVVVCRGKNPVEIRRLSTAILQSIHTYARLNAE